MTRAMSFVPLLFAVAALSAQGDPDPGVFWKKVDKGEPLIELQWRRDAKGNFEYAIAGKKDAEWTPWFGEGLLEVIGATGTPGLLAPLLNPSDFVGLTDAERHLRRMGVALPTGDLAAFVRTPLPEALGRTALFDRMVAIDLLRTRTDAETKTVVAQLGADKTLRKELAERAAGVVRRAKLDPAAWPLPKAPDVVVVIRSARMPSMQYLVDLGRFSGYASSAAVLSMLKAPTEKDLLLGETESEAMSGFAFELARRIGNHRFDEIGFAFCMPEDGADPEFSMCVAGAFDVAAMIAGAEEPLECEKDGDAAKLSLGDAAGRLTADRFELHSESAEVAPRAELAKKVLANADAVFLAHVPAASKLCAMATEIGLQGIQGADLAVTLREADVLLEARIGARDADAAKALAAAIQKQLKEVGWAGAAAKIALAIDESLLRIEAKDSTVNVTLPLPRSAIPSLEAAKAHVKKQLREQ